MCTIAAEIRNYLKEIPHPGRVLVWGAINLADPAVVTHSANCLTEPFGKSGSPSFARHLVEHEFIEKEQREGSRCP